MDTATPNTEDITTVWIDSSWGMAVGSCAEIKIFILISDKLWFTFYCGRPLTISKENSFHFMLYCQRYFVVLVMFPAHGSLQMSSENNSVYSENLCQQETISPCSSDFLWIWILNCNVQCCILILTNHVCPRQCNHNEGITLMVKLQESTTSRCNYNFI
jgi:hypothetical protein